MKTSIWLLLSALQFVLSNQHISIRISNSPSWETPAVQSGLCPPEIPTQVIFTITNCLVTGQGYGFYVLMISLFHTPDAHFAFCQQIQSNLFLKLPVLKDQLCTRPHLQTPKSTFCRCNSPMLIDHLWCESTFCQFLEGFDLLVSENNIKL